jgi:hypothetical protein
MLAVAGLLCVVSGVAVGRLPAWGQLVKAAPISAASQAANHHKGVPVQGVTVHGWWTIKVFDQKRLVSERQFENSLQTGLSYGGDIFLAALLTRQKSMGPWELAAFWASGNFVLGSAPDDGNNLTVNAATPGHVILSGNYTAVADISINRVQTSMYTCPAATAPASCVNAIVIGNLWFAFTSTNLVPSVPVTNGQIVQFKVDISFS